MCLLLRRNFTRLLSAIKTEDPFISQGILIFLFASLLYAQAHIEYEPWDWVTYRFSQHVFSISDGHEHVYFATPGGILQYNIFGRYWAHPITISQGMSDFFVYAVYYDLNTNILWASTKNGLDFSTDGGARWNHVRREDIGLRQNEQIIRIGSTSNDLYCVTSSQLLKVDRLSGFLILPYADIPSEYEVNWGSYSIKDGDYNEEILDGFIAQGGWTYELGWLNGPSLNEEARITSVHTDRFGDIWVGTENGPIFHGNSQLKLLEPELVGLAQTNVKTIELWEEDLWVAGTGDGRTQTGISLINKETATPRFFRRGIEITMGNDEALGIINVRGEWWFGSRGGIQIYNPFKDVWSLMREGSVKMDEPILHFETDNQFVYVGHSRGITRLNSYQKWEETWNLSSSVGRWPIDALEWDGSNLWVSSGRRLWRWLADADFIYQYGSFGEDLTGLREEDVELMLPVTSIVSFDSTVYFADENGLLMYNKNTGHWNRFTAESKLVGLKILDLDLVLLDDNTTVAWLATFSGAVMVNLENGYVRHFDVRDGLPDEKINSVRISGDKVWFGTDQGLCRFNWARYYK